MEIQEITCIGCQDPVLRYLEFSINPKKFCSKCINSINNFDRCAKLNALKSSKTPIFPIPKKRGRHKRIDEFANSSAKKMKKKKINKKGAQSSKDDDQKIRVPRAKKQFIPGTAKQSLEDFLAPFERRQPSSSSLESSLNTF